MKQKKFENLKVLIPLFIYWVILVIWQNANANYTSRSSADTIIKVCILLYLTIVFIKKDVRIKKNNLLLWVIFTVYFILMMFFTSENLSLGTMIFYLFPILFSFLTLVCHSEAGVNRKSYIIFLNLYICVVAYMALYSVIFMTDSFVNALSLNSAYGHELSSFLTSNHEYGMNLVFGIISSFICFKNIDNKKYKWIYILLILLFGANLILTFSRTSYLALCIFILCYMLLSKDKKTRIITIIIALSIVLLLCFNSEINNFVFKILLKSNNDAGRVVMWKSAIGEFLDYPVISELFGKGYESITNGYTLRFGHDSLHNMFVQNLVMWGVFGSIYFIGILVSSIKNAFKLRKIDYEMFSIFFALVFCCAAIMFTNTTCIMTSSLNSFMLTIFTLIVPKYVTNTICKEVKKEEIK